MSRAVTRRILVPLLLIASSVRAGPPAPNPPHAKPPDAKAPTPAPSPTETDPDKYKVILENARVRVFRYHDDPGARTRMHHHEAFVLYVLAPFKRRLTFPDGSAKERQFTTGDVIYMDAQDHLGENVGTTPTEALIVELKEPGAMTPFDVEGWKPGPAPTRR